ncbi:Putative DNA-binding protein in cluster with Type I restriction-modification system [hydrothermal vent metagenome]|uniref:Putative DNA-binding protein in cluster with Type I restriction-modification system n=1 Tax=hydrothermal vent metagenome TaxID=652676 RepID=A0A1W1CRR1_9ZZZZ
MNDLSVIDNSDIENKIFTIRGVQVMLDRDLASFNQAVKRNIQRFPQNFRFQLTKEELDDLRSQNVTFKENLNTKYLPYAFTEFGVSMLSAVLKSDIAIEISIKIIESFVNMRKIISSNSLMYERFERIEQRLSIHDANFEKIFKAIEDKSLQPQQGIFYNGEIFDAYTFATNLIKSAKKSIVLIDNYIDETTLTILSKNQKSNTTIYTSKISKQLRLDIEKYNQQYKKIELKKFNLSHDRFLIIDDAEVYHIGASLKDLGKKWFAFSKMDINSFEIMRKLQ